MSKKFLLLLILVVLAVLVIDARPRRGRGRRPAWKRRSRNNDQPLLQRMMRRWYSRHNAHRFNIGWSKDPWFNLDFNIFFDGMRQKNWWDGPNVCTDRRVKNKTLSDGDEISKHHVIRSEFCDDTDTAYKCQSSITRNGVKRTVTEIKECCKGFSRKPGNYGCPKEYKIQDIALTARDLKLNEFLRAVQSVNLQDTLRRGNFTIFAPNDDAFKKIGDDAVNLPKSIGSAMYKDLGSVVMVSKPVTDSVVKDLSNLLLGHVSTNILTTSRLNDEQLLETGSPYKTKIRINFYENQDRLMTANCRRVESKDNIASNGVIHIVEEILLPVSDTLTDIISRNPDFQYLKTAIGKSGLGRILREDGQLTVFAPTDTAFRKIDPVVLDRLLNDQRCLQKVIQNHVLPNVICSSAIQGKVKSRNLLQRYLRLTRDTNKKLFVDNSQVIGKDLMATNGVIHFIDEVLIPQDALNILDVLKQENATQVIDLLEVAGLKKTLLQADNITFFVPNNEAFAKLDSARIAGLRRDTKALSDVLKYHVSPTMTKCNAVYNGYEMDTLLPGKKITINEYVRLFFGPSRWIQTIQCAGIVKANIQSCNGVVHIIDKVLIPPSGTVIDVLSLDSRFSRLVELVKRSGIADALQQTGPFTVFAPTNNAFRKVPVSDLQRLANHTTELAKFLQSHVIKGIQCCAGIIEDDIIFQRSVVTLSGERYRLRWENGAPQIGNSNITECDLPATNGIVHVIEDVLKEKPQRDIWSDFF